MDLKKKTAKETFNVCENLGMSADIQMIGSFDVTTAQETSVGLDMERRLMKYLGLLLSLRSKRMIEDRGTKIIKKMNWILFSSFYFFLQH